jgi:16S rRNA (cytosine967-C5)-methyltransferase
MSQLSPARRVAFRILLRVETRAAYAVELLNADPATLLSPADHALAQELVMGCLRRQGELDWLIQHYSGKDPARFDPEVRVVLRMGVYQVRCLERIPARAAVDQSVELTRHAGKSSASALVNAVLRKVKRDVIAMPETARLSTPPWLLDRWGPEIAARNLERPVTFLRLPPGASSAWPQGSHGLTTGSSELSRGSYVRHCVIAPPGMRPDLPIQDEGSQIVPYLLDARDSHWILDLCAAPGNKTAAIAELAPDAHIVAADLYPARLRLVDAGMRVALDAAAPLPFTRLFDRVLLDAPCSGTGTVRRNPEIKWRLRPEDLSDLATKQTALLENAIAALAPGGRAVYSTCSLEPEENERVIEPVLARHPEIRLRPAIAERERLRDALTPEGLVLLGDPYFRVAPSAHGADGFFAAIIVRV